METLKTLLIANRGEIAVRIAKTAKRLGIRTIAIYTAADATSHHVVAADVAVLLPGDDATAYTDGDGIIEIAQANKVDAIIPGYGFLSENVEFAQDVLNRGMMFVGPSPDAIEGFGLKHRAREIAIEVKVPIVPGSQELLTTEEQAVVVAEGLGYPVMLKATAGGGGMGLMICHNPEELRKSFVQVKSRGEILFKNSGVFLERYYPESHHIEVQIFGNGQGEAIHVGERECSIQRRHQKVIEECPSPFVERNPGIREKLTSAAVALAESVKYGSAGTVEFLVDDLSGDFFFLEMNTRLQVEHGITELCYGLDLVELMLQQADHQLSGRGGLPGQPLKALQRDRPSGSAIEARVYAENPARNYQPSPGLLQLVEWNEVPGTRIDTWIETGSRISTFYDPMIAKVMVHSSNRAETIDKLHQVLTTSKVYGPPTNLEFLGALLLAHKFQSGHTLTNFLDSFAFSPTAVDVISPGVYTTIQDHPGRPSAGGGIPQSGPMDQLAFQAANILVGNARGVEALEITLKGPELRFLAPAVVSVCGAPITVELDGKAVPMWSRLSISRGQTLNVGKLSGPGGCRAYIAILGGFPAIAPYFGSKSTSPLLGIGGYQGRALAPGDLLTIQELDASVSAPPISLPETSLPVYPTNGEILVMSGPYEEGYILDEDIEMIYNNIWDISHNATRGGIRLVGPTPRWARTEGGDGGQHPTNVIEYGYPIGGMNWTGESACMFPVDAPDLGGFICSTTVVNGSLWRLGQVKSGDKVQFRRVSLEEALQVRQQQEDFLESITKYTAGQIGAEQIVSAAQKASTSTSSSGAHKAVIQESTIDGAGNPFTVTFRQGGDDYVLVEYGDGSFDLNHRCRVTALKNAIEKSRANKEAWSSNIYKTTGCCNSLLIHYNGLKVDRAALIRELVSLQNAASDITHASVPSRIFRLPICFDSPAQEEAIQRYIETQRPHAPFLPSNMDFVAKINGITQKELEKIFLTTKFMAICVGFFCSDTICLPIDPRYRLKCPKQNPSRVYTPEGSVSWGGSCMNIYPVDSPGGYQMTGQTIPCFDLLGSKPGFTPAQPGLFRDFDQITFFEVDNETLQRDMALFKSGRYQFQFAEATFEMEAYNRLIEETKDEVRVFKERQSVAEVEMLALEKASMEEWLAAKSQDIMPEEEIAKLRNDPNIITVDAPLDANVWKVQVESGDVIKPGHEVVILEAMKMEIAVHLNEPKAESGAERKFKVERVMASPGGTVKAGDVLVFVRET